MGCLPLSCENLGLSLQFYYWTNYLYPKLQIKYKQKVLNICGGSRISQEATTPKRGGRQPIISPNFNCMRMEKTGALGGGWSTSKIWLCRSVTECVCHLQSSAAWVGRHNWIWPSMPAMNIEQMQFLSTLIDAILGDTRLFYWYCFLFDYLSTNLGSSVVKRPRIRGHFLIPFWKTVYFICGASFLNESFTTSASSLHSRAVKQSVSRLLIYVRLYQDVM